MDRQTYRKMDVRMEGRTEFLPILQDFVPCQGRCPKRGRSFIFRYEKITTSALLQLENARNGRVDTNLKAPD